MQLVGTLRLNRVLLSQISHLQAKPPRFGTDTHSVWSSKDSNSVGITSENWIPVLRITIVRTTNQIYIKIQISERWCLNSLQKLPHFVTSSQLVHRYQPQNFEKRETFSSIFMSQLLSKLFWLTYKYRFSQLFQFDSAVGSSSYS